MVCFFYQQNTILKITSEDNEDKIYQSMQLLYKQNYLVAQLNY